MNRLKQHIPVVLILFALIGCSIDDSYLTTWTEKKQITITAIREDGDEPETRTVRNDKGKVYWSKGDQISLFYGQGSNGGSIFTSNQEADTVKVTNFFGTITAITGGGEISADETYFWGLYPYNENASCDGNSITTTLSSHQEAYPGSYANGTNISVGRSLGLIMGFYNACGGFRFSLNKEGVKKVTFKGNNGENLAGKLKISFVNGKIKTEILEGEKEVVLEAPAGKYFEPGVLYYIVLTPTVLSNGFTVKAETFTEEATFTYDSSITIEASNFKSKKLMDTGLTWTQKTGNIPVEDANFKAYLVENFDKNGDGEISFEEAAAVTSISVCTDNIKSAKGIEYMPGLNSLSLNGESSSSTTGASGKLEVLDVSNNTALTTLSCFNTQLTSIDVSNNTDLTYLNCNNNQLTNLDVSQNSALTILSCGGNQMTALDVSKNTALTRLYCAGNPLSNLDVSKNTALTSLSCGSGPLTSLDVSKNTALISLSCSTSQLTSLDISNNTALEFLYCHNTQLTSLDISNNTALITLSCSNTQLTSIDVSKNTALKSLSCEGNQMTALDVSNNIALTSLSCHYNQLTSLDISKNIALVYLYCANNQLTNLDVSNNTALKYLQCDNNDLGVIDVSKNTALERLHCINAQLTSLDISNNTLLKELFCESNSLTELDVTNNPEIWRLTFQNNNISSIDLSNNPKLEWIDCSGTGITVLDLSKCDESIYRIYKDSVLETVIIRKGQTLPSNIPESMIVVVPDEGGTGDNTDDEL